MPLQLEGSHIRVLGPVVSSNIIGPIRRTRELSDIGPQYISKSGLCSVSELESSRRGSLRIQHVTGLINTSEGVSRFPKLDECAHFHYEHVDIGPLQVSIIDDDDLKPLTIDSEEEKYWSLSVVSQNQTWLIRRSYKNFTLLDQQLHRCIYDRKFSELVELPAECIEEQENIHKLLSDYMKRFSAIAGNLINCGPVLNWLELDNRGHRLLVPDNDNCPINTPAVAAAYSVKRYTAQAPDEISFEVGDMISVIDMPPPDESIWWRGKRGFQVGFFPCECVAVIGDKVPRNFQFSSQTCQPTKPILRKHGKLIAFFRSFILSRPSRRRLKQSGILRERVFGCDLGEHLLNSGHEIPVVLKCCVEFIETNGLVDGIYRLSGITSNIQKLRNAFDEDRIPAIYEDESILQDVHSVASLLKMYFRELPNPLCTYQLYHQFVGAVQNGIGDDTRLLKMRDVVQKLPPPHYRTLEYLMRHLARVSEKGHETGMTSRNVAIVWAPNLLRCKELEVGGVAALQGVGVQAVVTEFLICYADFIFSDRLANFSLPTQKVSVKKCRPKSLAISTPTKLLSLEEARTRALLQASGKVEQEYIEVGGGPAKLPAKYHTIIELPGSSRKRIGSKRSPIGWKMLFGKTGRSSQSRKETENKMPANCNLIIASGKAITESDLAQIRRPLRPAKSAESLSSAPNSVTSEISDPLIGGPVNAKVCLSPVLLRHYEGKSNGHNRSVSHESYFDQLQNQKGDADLDISEIQLNFDLEESEMRIFSEDETIVSTGSGSLASNSSPRIHSIGNSGKGNGAKRLSYPKLTPVSDKFYHSQSADPSPKKQKTNDENFPMSKLEEQLSSSVGEIQFIDSTSPDQGSTQNDVQPIKSPSPVSSISQLSCSILASSSPILPHIPHLTKNSTVKDESHVVASSCKTFDLSLPAGESGKSSDSTNSCCTNTKQSFSVITIGSESNSYVTSPSLAEAIISNNESFDVLGSEITTPDTPICASYTPLIDFEESSISTNTTPEADTGISSKHYSLKNLVLNDGRGSTHIDDSVPSEHQIKKQDLVVIPDDTFTSSNCFNANATAGKVKDEDLKKNLVYPKPAERKSVMDHPYVNIAAVNAGFESRKLLETSFDVEEPVTSNRNSVASIKYECISTDSSCDSLVNVNKSEESALLLDFRLTQGRRDTEINQEQLSNITASEVKLESILLEKPKPSPSDQGIKELKSSNTTNSDKYSAKEVELPSGTIANEKNIEKYRNLYKHLKSTSPVCPKLPESSGLNVNNAKEGQIDIYEHSKTNYCGEPLTTRDSLRNNPKSTLCFTDHRFETGNNIQEKFVTAEKTPTEDNVNAEKIVPYVPSETPLFQSRSGKVLETDLDALEKETVGAPKLPLKTLALTKDGVPLKSNSSGNVRQLLSKFEASPTSEKGTMQLRLDFIEFVRKKETGHQGAFRRKSDGERSKTLERLCTKRKTDKDSHDRGESLLEKSKSGSQIEQIKPEGEKISLLLHSDADWSDPQRRERIEKYKEKRRNYLREKYRSDSSRNDKEDIIFKIKERHLRRNEREQSKVTAVNPPKLENQPSGHSSHGSAEADSLEKTYTQFSSSNLTKDTSPDKNSVCLKSDSSRDHSCKQSFHRLTQERRSQINSKISSADEKPNLSSSFSNVEAKRRENHSHNIDESKRGGRMAQPSVSSSPVPAGLESNFGSSFAKRRVNNSGCKGSISPPLRIKNSTALSERRANLKASKQYLSSV